MTHQDFTVFILGVDSAFRDSLALTLAYRGFGLKLFSNAAEFFAARADESHACVIVCLESSGQIALNFLTELSARSFVDCRIPVLLTASDSFGASIPFVRAAFLAGAVDVLPPRFDCSELFSALDRVAALAERRWVARHAIARETTAPAVLTRRESEIAEMVRQGFDNRAIGRSLGISHRTVEIHKTRLLRKLGVRSVSGLIALPVVPSGPQDIPSPAGAYPSAGT